MTSQWWLKEYESFTESVGPGVSLAAPVPAALRCVEPRWLVKRQRACMSPLRANQPGLASRTHGADGRLSRDRAAQGKGHGYDR